MILVLEDDKELRDSLVELLEDKSYKVQTASNIHEFYSAWNKCKEDIEIILLDIKLPDGDGFSVCEDIRKNSNIPIIFITSYDDEKSIVKGLDIGADDYVTKPFKVSELLSRIAANIRRNQYNVGRLYKKGDLEIYFDKYKVFKNGCELNISSKEFEIIKMLIENKGMVVRRETIFENIWDSNGVFVEYNTLTVSMSRIKAKLGTNPDDKCQYIDTIRNVGYRWID